MRHANRSRKEEACARNGVGGVWKCPDDVAGTSKGIDLFVLIVVLSLSFNFYPFFTARSFITIKDQKFVDENCNDYVVAG